ncbi:UDP-glucose 4-epimerase [Chitinophaga terrae (ex Kim and Jung 2007)]|uniref:UDP-glucose 4-epimerase n=1 Tax=Chitinophaga terrae (ex Kim and Jung 2007) TaxID=408074 RepID=A0A1H4CTJ8_9BACT|nr:UDP-glucose 4-epimerase GalE [Chitinophaga terrae (ex Kim and Jung 2007)]MDQ0105275.1 UDP-glucose 4-epimerase [Chitinophaga terrae (ex Kim and Jung 2007)]GEP90458.1 UDP-glucose 4-epimerase [Chitinophaga terrae (ex Kim and Jung 2007)]SEA63705.1 UDP-glucose 4-epimerase [Chitinophaga terrae (ex Kim and Jung 2007)]
MKVLVTGGCGYIGAHTIVDLINNGFDVVSVDSNIRSTTQLLDGIEKITGKKVRNYKVDLCNLEDTNAVFHENRDIVGVIHFAALKAVGESVHEPLLYFQNNLTSLINVLKCVKEYNVPNLVFSSSCSVYGNTTALPVVEETPLAEAQSPYARTKQMGEKIIEDYSRVNDTQSILLRYFNPVGAHPSALIGELPLGKPDNLVPVITQTAIGKIPKLTVFGDDYNTKDGSCVRDYIHVMDIANAHTKALQYLIEHRNESNCEVFNLGTGNGVTVLEAIKAFEKISGVKLNYTIGPRREGDVIAIYANNTKAKEKLQWEPKIGIEDSMRTAWQWEVSLRNKVLSN